MSETHDDTNVHHHLRLLMTFVLFRFSRQYFIWFFFLIIIIMIVNADKRGSLSDTRDDTNVHHHLRLELISSNFKTNFLLIFTLIFYIYSLQYSSHKWPHSAFPAPLTPSLLLISVHSTTSTSQRKVLTAQSTLDSSVLWAPPQPWSSQVPI